MIARPERIDAHAGTDLIAMEVTGRDKTPDHRAAAALPDLLLPAYR
jgi:hypothetical protein